MNAVESYNNASSNAENRYGDADVKTAYDNLQKIKDKISDDSDWMLIGMF